MNDLDILFSLINLQYICRANNVKCEVYETSKGIHVYIYYPCKEYDLFRSIAIRSILKDDDTRIAYDLERWRCKMYRWVETLFKAKIGRVAKGRKKVVVKKSVETPVSLDQLINKFLSIDISRPIT